MEIKRSYRVRVYPNRAQEQRLLRMCGATRFVWNYYLDKRRAEYLNNNRRFAYIDCAKDLTQLKKLQEFQWLGDTLTHALQQSLRDLDTAYNRFLRKEANF